MRIEGRELPGGDDLRLRNVHVGVQRKAVSIRGGKQNAKPGDEVVSRVPVGAASAVWELDVAVREIDGLLDVGGPFVHGRPGARFLYLSWGNVSGDRFEMFRRAKLMFGDIPTAVLRDAFENGGVLVGELGLTDEYGDPRCARVRPPDIVWTRRS